MGQYDRKAQSQRKHGPIISSSTSKAPARPPPSSKPEWRGSGYTKKAKPKPHLDAPKESPTPQSQLLPVELQQLMLNIFKDSFGVDFEEIKDLLREINEAVLEGDWEAASGTEGKRKGYVVRWSPSRALAYANVLVWLVEQRPEDDWVQRLLSSQSTRVLCFGGGAAEVMAFAGLLRHLRPELAGRLQQDTAEPEAAKQPPILDLHLIDRADWTSTTSTLVSGLTTPPPLSKYASATARASNTSFLWPSSLNLAFSQHNIFNLLTTQLRSTVGSEPVLATLFLTLTDLYKSSIPKTTAFLQKLDAVLPKDSVLVVIDSIAASASLPPSNPEHEVQSYPMDWLLDRVLLGKAHEKPVQRKGKKTEEDEEEEEETAREVNRWEKVVKEERKVHRLDEKLRYPGSLENVRFQLHVFRRI